MNKWIKINYNSQSVSLSTVKTRLKHCNLIITNLGEEMEVEGINKLVFHDLSGFLSCTRSWPYHCLWHSPVYPGCMVPGQGMHDNNITTLNNRMAHFITQLLRGSWLQTYTLILEQNKCPCSQKWVGTLNALQHRGCSSTETCSFFSNCCCVLRVPYHNSPANAFFEREHYFYSYNI